MRPGRMDRQITIQSYTEAQDASGHPIKTWSAGTTVWAERTPVKGTESFMAQQKYATAEVRFTIWYLAGVSPLNRILDDGRYYDIVAVLEVGRRVGLDILAKARAE